MKKNSLLIALLILVVFPLLAQQPQLVIPVGHVDAITCLSISEDGKYLVSGSKDLTVKLWNEEERLIRTFGPHDSPLVDVNISPDQKFILARTELTYYLWNFEGILEWQRPALAAPGEATVAAYDKPVFTTDGTSLLYAEPGSKAVLYNLETAKFTRFPCDQARNMKLSPNEELILTSVGDELQLFNRKGKLKKKIPVDEEEEVHFLTDFSAEFLGDDHIIVSFTYATSTTVSPPLDFSNGGYSKILNLKGELISNFGSTKIIPGEDGYYVYKTEFSEETNQFIGTFEKINLSILGGGSGGPMDTSERMDWNESDISQTRDKMVVSNRKFTQVRSLPSGEGLLLLNEEFEDYTYPSFFLGFNPSGDHLAMKIGGQLWVFDLDRLSERQDIKPDTSIAALSKQEGVYLIPIAETFAGNHPFGGWPSPFTFIPNSDEFIIGDEKGNIWKSNVRGDNIQRFGLRPLNKLIAAEPSTSAETTIDLYFSDESPDVSSSYISHSGEVAISKKSFSLSEGIFITLEEDFNGDLPLKAKNVHRASGYEIFSYEYYLKSDYYRAPAYSYKEGVVFLKPFDTTQVSFNFRAAASISDLELIQGRYLITSDFENQPVLWDLEVLKSHANQQEETELASELFVKLIPDSLAQKAQLRAFQNLPIRTKYLDSGQKHSQLLFKRRNEWNVVEKNGYEQYVEEQYLGFSLLNIESGEVVDFSGHSLKLMGAVFLSDEQYIISWAEDRTCIIWDAKTGAELLKLLWFNEKYWLVLSPEGLFDASPGMFSELYYVVGKDEIIEVEQLKARYYEPGLLQKTLAYVEESIRSVENFTTVALYPVVKAVIDSESGTLNINLQERNGGIGKVSIFINGKEVIEEANPLPRRENAKRDSIMEVDLKQYQNFLLRHPDSTNIISVRAYNEEGWLKSKAINLEYKLPAARTRGVNNTTGSSGWVGQLNPKLYVISIGTSNYTGSKLDLQYADQDATMMAKALQSVGTALFTNGDSLDVHCLSTASTDSTGLEQTPIHWQFANKKNIRATFEAVKSKAKAEDVIVVYLSGHGVTQSGQDQTQFYYLTQGVASPDDLADPTTLRAYTISSEELTKWINDIPALKQVLIIDACNSGQIVEELTGGTKSLNSSQIRALDRMKDRTGMFVLSGSASDKVSYEAGEYGQGLLTYALLQGMLGVATRKDSEGQKIVDVMTLFQYARDEVPRLAASINGVQTPMLGFPSRAASFDIGMVNDNTLIPIGDKKPVVIRNTFLNEDTYRDDLQLANLLENVLRQETEEGTRADLIYVDVYDYPDAYSLGGFYTVTGDGIQLKVKLFHGDQPPIDLDIPLAENENRLVKHLMRAIKKTIKRIEE